MGAVVKILPTNSGDAEDMDLIPGLGSSPEVGNSRVPGKFHGQRRLVGYSPWSHKESDMTEHTYMHVLI